MKYIFLCSISLLMAFNCYGQNDSLQTNPYRWLRIHGTSGVNFIRSEALQENYNTKALFFWGLGVRVGYSQKSNLFAQLDYNFSRYHSIEEGGPLKGDSLLRINQLVPSLSFELLRVSNSAIRSKVGYIAAFLKDDKNKPNALSSGFRIGIGIEKKIWRNQAIHLDLDYDLIKAQGDIYKDYDLWKLSMGMYL
jgi:hypothetical protein